MSEQVNEEHNNGRIEKLFLLRKKNIYMQTSK